MAAVGLGGSLVEEGDMLEEVPEVPR